MRLDRTLATSALAFAVAALSAISAEAQDCGNGLPEYGQDVCVAAPVTVLTLPNPVLTVLAQDLNGDAHPDVIAITSSGSFVRFGAGAGFGPTLGTSYAGAQLTDLAIGDFNHDARPDLAMSERLHNRVMVRYNQGAGGFGPVTSFPVGNNPIRLLAADLNDDGAVDLITLNDDASTVSVLLATPLGFAPAATYAVGNAVDIALGDCEHNGSLDLYYVTGSGPGAVMNIRRNHGTGVLQPPDTTPYPLVDPVLGPLRPRAIAAGDLDGDSLDDVVVSTTQTRLVPGTSNGNGTVAPQTMAYTWASTENRLRVVSYDGDGLLDVAAPHVWGNSYSIAWGNGNGSFGFASVMYGYEDLEGLTTTPVRDLAFADFDGDGALDVAVATGAGVVVQTGQP